MSLYVTIARQEATNGGRGKAAKRKHEVTDNDRSVTRAACTVVTYITLHLKHNTYLRRCLSFVRDDERRCDNNNNGMSSSITISRQEATNGVRDKAAKQKHEVTDNNTIVTRLARSVVTYNTLYSLTFKRYPNDMSINDGEDEDARRRRRQRSGRG
jgi:hypothetical protein